MDQLEQGLVLIVEDDPSLRNGLSDALKTLNLQVITASDGQEALDLLKIYRPHAVLSDISMPKISGLQLVEQMRMRGIMAPCILLTGQLDQNTTLRALRLGIKEFIEKPFDTVLLLESVSQAVKLGLRLNQNSFKIECKEELIVVRCSTIFDSQEANSISNQVQLLTQVKGIKLVVLDFSETEVMSALTYRVISSVWTNLKKGGCTLSTVGMSGKLTQQIRNDGVLSILMHCSNISEARSLAGLSPTAASRNTFRLDTDFVNPFINAAIKVFQIQASLTIVPGKATLKSNELDSNIDIIGVISHFSKSFSGTIGICFPEKVFLGVYAKMFDEVHKKITPEIEDAASELLNMIFGQAKAELNQKKNYEIQRAIPVVISGTNLKFNYIFKKIAILIPFKTDLGVFYLEIGLEEEAR